MPDFQFSELLPTGPDRTEYRLLTADGVSSVAAAGRTFLQVRPEALTRLAYEAMHDIAHFLRPAHLAQLRSHPRRPAGLRQRPVRGAGPAEERQRVRRRRAADVPGHRHRDRAGQEGRGRADRRRRRGGDRPRRLRRLHPAGPALLPAGAADDVGGAQHRHQPAGAGRALRERAARRARVLVPVHGQGRRLGEQVVPLPGDQGGPEPGVDDARSSTRSCVRSAPRPARRTTSPSSSAGRRRRARAEDGEAGVGQVPRHAADQRLAERARVPRPGDGGAGPGADPGSSGSVRSSAASTSATTCGSSGCRGTARRSRSRSRSPARRTGRRAGGSPPTGCSWSSSSATPRATCRTPRTSTCPTTWCASTSTGRWTRSAPSWPATRSGRGCR